MATICEPTTTLFNAIKSLLPGLPDDVSKLTLTLEAGKMPLVECTFCPAVDDEVSVPAELITCKCALVPVGETLSGEQGPELVSFSQPSKVYGAAGSPGGDPRIDEIVLLLKRIACLAEKDWLSSRVPLVNYDTVHVAGGGPGGMSSSSQSGPNAGHWHPDAEA